MDKMARDHPLVYHIKDRRNAKVLRREINRAFDDIDAAISGISSRIRRGKYPIWHFDAVIEEVLAYTRVSPEIQELMEAENISLTDVQTQLLTTLISSAFVIFDLNDAKKIVGLIKKLEQLDDGVVKVLSQSKRFGEKAFQKLSVERLNALDDNFMSFFSNDIENIVRMYKKRCLPIEFFDSEILFYGLEKDFNVPSCPVEFCNITRG